ncbi:WD40 repeat-like-containing domain protein [Niveomyces insectorum RCEF 264]|uniref:WD40 repeat-like-containing domain protein n=1 Tax=Niveomyces insectorum RCEF 264 TaxID=1081102 RepID=A0A167QE93_9HYPO|nr:WD40 repeat-like-containing domain protein [Niveomyces insectorum RCEF 264]
MSAESGNDRVASAERASEPGSGLESLLAQLRRKSDQEAASSASLQPHDLLSHFASMPSPADQYYPPQQQQQQQQQHASSPNDAGSFTAFPTMSRFASNLSSSSLPAAPTPPVGGNFPNAQFPPSMLGSIGSGRPNGERGTSSHLLNLLKFSGHANPPPSGLSQPPSVPQSAAFRDEPELQQQQQQQQQQHTSVSGPPSMIHAPAPAPSDPSGLLAALMQGTHKDEPPKPEPSTQQAPSWSSTSQSNETQQYLLNLLNRPKPSQNDESFSTESSKSNAPTPTSGANRQTSQPQTDYASFDSPAARASASPVALGMPTSVFDFEVKSAKTHEDATPKTTLFDHHNPFEGLGASSPYNRTPKSSTTPGAPATLAPAATQPALTAPPVQILRKPAPQNTKESKPVSSVASPEQLADKKSDVAAVRSGKGSAHTPSDDGAESDTKETDVGVGGDSANHSSDDTKDDRASDPDAAGQAEINKDLEEMMHAKTDKEFQAAAQAAGRAIQKELDRDDKHSALEDALSPGLAKTVRDIVDEAAQGPVAESWESAGAEGEAEEQSPPVKVYNFPMKPFISIDVQDDDKDSRPVFGHDSILDIARLKKEFDQIDRNLVAASENYMVYGMSKAGGLRVIRQSDGRDAKLFTDTKDRIFNVAMSHNNGDTGGYIPKDSILGTGISGTVYWVQIRDGDKDHLDYAHPELYGFALPPILSHEGDAPGGVLKTRARTSTGHPEYFAVGRGKSINIVWPSFIMQNDLFQPGHDRVVDTEKLAKQCSLKINTGKAGKDFTFSQDDSVVVSLDKSGRVKFWDVRDLTAIREGSDPRNPMPAFTSLEVKEPLMTLTTTPEGEKAWPTSVLLLDKMRPYQKRCALRYMIVGMKQNHTLQLWDLALGKPVQEFNLPHSKESDAVCSVMYHPPTGMIVVGHPTRNSVYILHLSAPKYAMKNFSQVDYIQRLTARDSSIPQPESTAVISGLREYSFANRGALRSLDILQNPAATSDSDNPTLFELYAMHSKGVSCIFVRQGELGWTKDNSVLEPVDAVDAGKVKIGKLKSPQQPTPVPDARGGPAENGSSTQQAPRVIASRPAAKELFQPNAPQDGASRKSADASSLTAKLRALGAKDEEGAAQLSGAAAPSVDKTDKKSRKKKNAAAAAAAAASTAAVGGPSPAVAERDAAVSNGSDTLAADSSKSAGTSGPAKPTLFGVGHDAIDTRINTMEARICERVASSVTVAFDDMKKGIDQQFRSRDADFEQRQRKLLDLVSNVLNSNTELVLSKIVRDEFDKSVVPILRDDVTRSVTEQLGSKINAQVSSVLQRELQKALPAQVSNSLRSPEVSKAISDKVAHAVASHVDERLNRVVANELIPALSSMSAQTVHKMAQGFLQKMAEHFTEQERIYAEQRTKVDSLVSLVTDLSETVTTMATAQAQYQSQLLKLQNQTSQAQLPPPYLSHGPPQQQQQQQPPPPPPPQLPQPPHAPQQLQQQQQQHAQPYQHQQHPPQHALQHPPQHPPQHLPHRAYDNSGQSSYHSPTGRVANQVAGANLSPSQQQQHHVPRQEVLFAPKSQEEREREELEHVAGIVEELLVNGKCDDAMMRWLQSNGKEEELFRRVIFKFPPEVLTNLQPLVLLSVGTTVTQNLDGPLLPQKLNWVEMVILKLYQVANQLDDQTREITPSVLLHIGARLEQALMRISKVSNNDPSLKNIPRMISVINRIVDVVNHQGNF